MKNILIIIMSLILFQKEHSLNELIFEINICKVEQEALLSSLIATQLVGYISLHNKSSDLIVLPKSFDLEIVLWDSAMIKVGRRMDINVEYHNLIQSQRSIRIEAGEKVEIDFLEWRLFMFDLVPDNNYFIQYILHPSVFTDRVVSSNHKEIKSNIVSFRLQPNILGD
jgi:hypothetical protein